MKEQYEEKIIDETTRSSAKSRQSGDTELMCVVILLVLITSNHGSEYCLICITLDDNYWLSVKAL